MPRIVALIGCVVLVGWGSGVSFAVEPPSVAPEDPAASAGEYRLLPDDFYPMTEEQSRPELSEEVFFLRYWAAPVMVGGDDWGAASSPLHSSSTVWALADDTLRSEFLITPNLGWSVAAFYERYTHLARKANLLPCAHQDGYWMSVWATYGDFFPALGCLYAFLGGDRVELHPGDYVENYFAYRIADVDRETVYQPPAERWSTERLEANAIKARYGILTQQKLPPEYVCSRDKYVFTEFPADHPKWKPSVGLETPQTGCLQEKVIFVKNIKEGEDGVRTAEIGTVGKRLDQIYPFEYTRFYSGNGGGVIQREPAEASPLYSTPFVGALPNRPIRNGTFSVLDRKPEEHVVLLRCRFNEPRRLGGTWRKWDEEGRPPVWIRYEPIVWRTYTVGDTIELGNNGDMRLSGLYKITRIEPTREDVTIGEITGRLIGWIEIDPSPVEVE